ncbi:MAG: zinc-binding dehydrogenase [Rhizobiales bacterium]|nr:zinc-binding dehydrogenase [Hyphomicrobiales bacterium]
MKALVLNAAREPFELKDVPDPVAGPGEAVAKVLACGSGLTIQHVKAGRQAIPFPRIIGHEIAGEIVETGEGVSGLAVGDPVTIHFYMFCGHCRYCLAGREPLCENLAGQVGKQCDGGYAQYLKLPERNFIKLPEGIDYEDNPAEAAVIADALATPYKVLRRGRVGAGNWVGVFGAGGGVGLHQVVMAKWAGARVIAVDIARDKFAACRSAGAEHVVDAAAGRVAEEIAEITSGRGLDVAVDYVCTDQTLEAAASSLGADGRLVTLGGTGQKSKISLSILRQAEREVLSSRYVSRAEIVETLDLVASGAVAPIVSEVRPMEEAEELHEMIEAATVTGRAALLIA